MNRDDILKMEAGREMNALVAEKVMGQKDFKHPDLCYEEGNTEDGSDGWSGFYCPRCGATEENYPKIKCAKHYSTDIAAAWEVVERMREIDHNWCPHVFWDDNDGLHPGEWGCSMDYYGDDKKDFRQVWVNSDSAPLSICRAALLAVMGLE